MRVSVTRSGGFAGIERRWEIVIEQQPDEEAWLVFIGDLPWNDAAVRTTGEDGTSRDRFVYRIRCEPPPPHAIANERPTPPAVEAELPEQNLTGKWRELVSRVREASAASGA